MSRARAFSTRRNIQNSPDNEDLPEADALGGMHPVRTRRQ
jgi:hypothetical protein